MNDKQWLVTRIGDSGDYEKLGSISEFINMIEDSYPEFKMLFSNPEFIAGGLYTDSFKGLNYISCFWGDSDYQFVKSLTVSEELEVIESLKLLNQI